MYIRWVVRRHKNAEIANTNFHDAYLVESYRDERGQPRQRTIAYLGNIRQIGDEFPTIERELFLLRADRILESLPDLTESDRQEAREALRRKVPPLTRDEVIRAFTANLTWYRQWLEQNGCPLNDDELLSIVRTTRSGLEPI
ncbi:hypothetical protein [Chloroflexus aggregans]|uniref:Uncharacterized protein n=1 Tax=Chloroflexus aggregans (strain MD-66 / DSM 9485) TaxID=326427 RepID=B8G7F6_CHLAD|nr:hypothetical protein [Chloroflexus aggregans]ACL25991.1 conserved hypothetical protein [Chloroflexus aggregans DSM 9485]